MELTVSFQHVDALSDLEKTAARYQRDTREARESERERQLALQQAEAKAVHVAVKSSEPDEGMPEGRSKIKEMLQDFADEPWQRMTWTDHDVSATWPCLRSFLTLVGPRFVSCLRRPFRAEQRPRGAA